MQHTKIKQFVLLLGLLLPAAWCGANSTHFNDGFSHIAVKERAVQGTPKVPPSKLPLTATHSPWSSPRTSAKWPWRYPPL